MSLTPGTHELLNNPGAFEAFVEKNHFKFVGAALKVVKDRDMAEQIVQEAITRFWCKLPEITSDKNLAGYCSQTVWSISLDHYRRTTGIDHRRMSGEAKVREVALSDASMDIAADPGGTDPLREVVKMETTAEVREVLDLLLPVYRTVLREQFYLGTQPKEYAEKYGVSLTNAKSRYHRARESFRATWNWKYGRKEAA